jgi:hypothetical protein
MNSKDLQPWQAEVFGQALFRHVNYLYRLKSRMEKVGFLPGDPLFREVCEAYDAVHKLSVTLHYLSCTSGVGLSPKKPG